MTNLSPDQSVWRRRFSRGRILVGVPAAFGVVLAGALFVLAGMYGWVLEPSVNPEEPHDHDDHGPAEPDGDPEPVGQIAAAGEDV